MTDKIKELIKQVGTDTGGKWISADKAEELVKLVVAECYIAIENTKTHHVYTTFDESLVKQTIRNSKEAVQQHFGV